MTVINDSRMAEFPIAILRDNIIYKQYVLSKYMDKLSKYAHL